MSYAHWRLKYISAILCRFKAEPGYFFAKVWPLVNGPLWIGGYGVIDHSWLCEIVVGKKNKN